MYGNDDEKLDLSQYPIKDNGSSSVLGVLGALLSVIILFLPFAKNSRISKSIFGITTLYWDAGTDDFGGADRATFYRVFMTAVVAWVVLFAIMYLVANVKGKRIGMWICSILTIIVYEMVKYDFSDRGIVPGYYKQGIAFALIWCAYILMILGAILRKKHN